MIGDYLEREADIAGGIADGLPEGDPQREALYAFADRCIDREAAEAEAAEAEDERLGINAHWAAMIARQRTELATEGESVRPRHRAERDAASRQYREQRAEARAIVCDHPLDISAWPAGTWKNETIPDRRVRVVCSVCGKFYGYRRSESKAPTLPSKSAEAGE